MAILNYSTKIPPEKTVSEIQARLVKNGANRLSFDYDTTGNLASLMFNMQIETQTVHFVITPNFDGVLAVMKKGGVPKNLQTPEQAVRVAWRIEKDWLEAQLAKIESGLATPLQLLLPYAVISDGRTFYQSIQESGMKKLLN